MSLIDKAMAANSKSGKQWLIKYLHPPAILSAAYEGYPDTSNTPLIKCEWRLNTEIDPFLDNPQGTFDCIYLDSPGLFYPHFRFTSPNAVLPTRIESLVLNDQVNKSDITLGFSRQRLAYRSTTYYLDSNAFNSQGRVYSCQYNPSQFELDVTTFTRLLMEIYDEEIFTMNADESIELNWNSDKTVLVLNFYKMCVAVYGEPAEVSELIFYEQLHHHPRLQKYRHHLKMYKSSTIQDKIDLLEDSYEDDRVGAITFTATKLQIADIGDIISSPTSITQASPKSYTDAAIEGSFHVHHINQPFNEWKSNEPAYYNGGNVAQDSLLICCYIQSYVNTNGVRRIVIDAFRYGTPTLADPKYCADVRWSDFSWQYTAFTGLSQTNVAGNPRIAVKIMQGFEFNPAINSIFNTFAVSPPTYDPEALDSAVRIVQNECDAVQSKYNGLGFVAALAEGAMSALGMADAIPKHSPVKLTKSDKAEAAAIENKEVENIKEESQLKMESNMAPETANEATEGVGVKKRKEWTAEERKAHRKQRRAKRNFRQKDNEKRIEIMLKAITSKINSLNIKEKKVKKDTSKIRRSVSKGRTPPVYRRRRNTGPPPPRKSRSRSRSQRR